MPYVVSTLSNNQIYAQFGELADQDARKTRPAVRKHGVLVKGGAKVQGALHTPEGVLTKISEDDAKFLESIPLFQLHQKGGYVKFVNREVNPDKVANDMRADNGEVVNGERISGGSSQLSVALDDFKAGGRAGGIGEREGQVAPTI